MFEQGNSQKERGNCIHKGSGCGPFNSVTINASCNQLGGFSEEQLTDIFPPGLSTPPVSCLNRTAGA